MTHGRMCLFCLVVLQGCHLLREVRHDRVHDRRHMWQRLQLSRKPVSKLEPGSGTNFQDPALGEVLSQTLHISNTPQLLKLCHELESKCSKHEPMENITQRNHNSECIAIIRIFFLFFYIPQVNNMYLIFFFFKMYAENILHYLTGPQQSFLLRSDLPS